MTHRFILTVTLAAFAIGGMTACGKKEPEGPTPEEMRQDSIRQAEEARQDSIRLAEQARQDSIAANRDRDEALARETSSARDILQEMVHFDYDQTSITSDAQAKLMQKVAVMRANPDVRIRVAGHADERGSIEYNRALSQRRAESVRDFMTNYGIPMARINTVSFGEDRPLMNASNERAWAQNRRAEFSILTGGDQMRVPGGP